MSYLKLAYFVLMSLGSIGHVTNITEHENTFGTPYFMTKLATF